MTRRARILPPANTVTSGAALRTGRGGVPGSPARPPRHSRAAGRARPRERAGKPAPVRKPWSRSQEKLALLYNEQGLRPAEIAQKLGVRSHLVTQIILAAKNRGKS